MAAETAQQREEQRKSILAEHNEYARLLSQATVTPEEQEQFVPQARYRPEEEEATATAPPQEQYPVVTREQQYRQPPSLNKPKVENFNGGQQPAPHDLTPDKQQQHIPRAKESSNDEEANHQVQELTPDQQQQHIPPGKECPKDEDTQQKVQELTPDQQQQIIRPWQQSYYDSEEEDWVNEITPDQQQQYIPPAKDNGEEEEQYQGITPEQQQQNITLGTPGSSDSQEMQVQVQVTSHGTSYLNLACPVLNLNKPDISGQHYIAPDKKNSATQQQQQQSAREREEQEEQQRQKALRPEQQQQFIPRAKESPDEAEAGDTHSNHQGGQAVIITPEQQQQKITLETGGPPSIKSNQYKPHPSSTAAGTDLQQSLARMKLDKGANNNSAANKQEKAPARKAQQETTNLATKTIPVTPDQQGQHIPIAAKSSEDNQQEKEDIIKQQSAGAAAGAGAPGAAVQQAQAQTYKVVTFQNLGTDPAMANAELYYESTRWGPLRPGDAPVTVTSFPGHRWFIAANGIYAKLFVVGESEDKQTFTF